MNKMRRIVALAASLLGAMSGLSAPAAQGQTITNTAQATWHAGTSTQKTSSNAVNVSVQPARVTVETLIPVPDGPHDYSFMPSLCGQRSTTDPTSSDGTVSITSLEHSSTVTVGNTLYFRISAPQANVNVAARDQLSVIITSDSGDRETLTVYESELSSGIFIGSMPTATMPPAMAQGDCRLSTVTGNKLELSVTPVGQPTVLASAAVDVLADPYGLVFDSQDGTPVSGVRVTLINTATGQPAKVFGDDGITSWPASVVTGQPIVDGNGVSHAMLPGEYRFPLTALGSYKLIVEPEAPYSAPSKATPAQLAGLTRPNGAPFLISDGSYGRVFTLVNADAIRVDVPIDRPTLVTSLTKTVSRASAQPGDLIFYTITARNPDPTRRKRGMTLVDLPSPWLRLREDTIRVDGVAAPAALQIAPDGKKIVVNLGDIPGGGTRTVTYAMSIRPEAQPGIAMNEATATDALGNVSRASAVVRIEEETLANRMTLIGRVTDGGCDVNKPHVGIPGVRMVLEDGSFAITDENGRYHFEGLVPGTHVVQAQAVTLPEGGEFTDCTRSTRSAGSASSRFVIGQGGSLVVADFSAKLPHVQATRAAEGSPADKEADEEELKASALRDGAGIDWIARGNGDNAILFPAADYNPRTQATRVVIRHRADQKVELLVDGNPVKPVAFDGMQTAPGRAFAISLWSGIPLDEENTRLTATLRNADGSAAGTLERTVHFNQRPARVEVVADKTRLVADGSSRPVIALRILDRSGRPVHEGISGSLSISAPYESAAANDQMQMRALTRTAAATPRWTVEGDDGIALVELAPTMVSGKLRMEFTFRDGQQSRRQDLEAWIVPGDQPWTVVGLAEGSVGERSVASNMERSGQFDSDLGTHARVALYAKGRILGRYLLTAAYDSAKQRRDQRLLGVIDPRAYYTVFADGSERRFDAASRNKLYVRIETAAFYALYGDFDTGFDQTQLARYQRTLTGVKGELNSGGLHVQGFAAKVNSTHRRDEIQGAGLSGPYTLSNRAIVPNSEIVSIEVRDRFRSEVIVERRLLSRFIDYNIDLLSGTITFKQPVESRDFALNPQFIVIDYEIDELAGGGRTNAGLRADVTTAKGRLRIGATALTDTSSGALADRTDLAAVDLRARIGNATEIRAEAGISRRAGETAQAWLVEAEHHDGKLDVLAYARSTDEEYGVGQLNGAERGRRKYGLETRYELSEGFSLNATAWHDEALKRAESRDALEAGVLYRNTTLDARLGIAMMRDTRADGTQARSTVLEGAVAKRFLDNRLELGAASSIALDKTQSVDLPQRHRFTARYNLNSNVKLIGTYEIANGDNVKARTANVGLEVSPWRGSRVTTTLGRQSIAEYGPRSFAAFGLAQTLDVSKNLTLDATFEKNKTIRGLSAGDLINPAHPGSSGGFIGTPGSISEDFTAATLGATWRQDLWTATARAEIRDGELADRKGLTFGVIRQLGEGSTLGSGFTWTRAKTGTGQTSEVMDGAIALAHRPADSAIAMLGKLEFRSDKVTNAIVGEVGAAGRTALGVTGDAKSRRIIGSISANWSPHGKIGDEGSEQFVRRDEIGLFAAVRHNFDSYQGFDLTGTTFLGGMDARMGLGDRFEVGVVGNVRVARGDHTVSYSVGPQIGFSPSYDVLLTVGYNLKGFSDRDFSAARTTDQGFFATLRAKFDASTLSFLGLGQR